jgi:hypothetical protein
VHGILLSTRMLGKKDTYCLERAVMAACLALLLTSASLVPSSARSFSESTSSCCRSRAKCSCRKNAKGPSGPTLSRKSCGGECGRLTLGGIAASRFLQPSSRALAPPVEILTSVCDSESAPAAHLSDHSLQQRPPPAFPLV